MTAPTRSTTSSGCSSPTSRSKTRSRNSSRTSSRKARWSIDNPAPSVGDTLTIFSSTINDFEGVLVNGVLDAATAGFERTDIPLNELNFQWQYQDQNGVGGADPAHGCQ